ncbi:hypothetical protein P7C70_g7909, partial [Phenoliferia sp. Uapishka_3]
MQIWKRYNTIPVSVLWDVDLPIFSCGVKLNFKSELMTGLGAQGWESSTCADATTPAEKIHWKRIREEDEEEILKRAKLSAEADEQARPAREAERVATALRLEATGKLYEGMIYWLALRFLPRPGAELPLSLAEAQFLRDAKMFPEECSWAAALAFELQRKESRLRMGSGGEVLLDLELRTSHIDDELVKWVQANYFFSHTRCVLAQEVFDAFRMSPAYRNQIFGQSFVSDLISLSRPVNDLHGFHLGSTFAVVVLGMAPIVVPGRSSHTAGGSGSDSTSEPTQSASRLAFFRLLNDPTPSPPRIHPPPPPFILSPTHPPETSSRIPFPG